MKFEQVLDLVRKSRNLRNDLEMAKYFEMSDGGYRHMKKGRGGLKDSTVRKIMDATDLQAVDIEAAWKSEFARDPKVRKSWANWRAAGAIVILSLMVGGISSFPSISYANIQTSENGYYAQLVFC